MVIKSNGKKVKSSNGKHWMDFHWNISEQKYCGIKVCPKPPPPPQGFQYLHKNWICIDIVFMWLHCTDTYDFMSLV